MKVLYIGQYSEGTTSKMRADVIKKHLNPALFDVIDLHKPFLKSSRIWRSLAFRFKFGPTIKAVNTYIKSHLNLDGYDLIWVDKAFFISPEITELLKNHSRQLVHFTPDMAFFANKSNFFINSIPLYDFVITTKLKELELYQTYTDDKKILLVTQGFSNEIHKCQIKFEDKDDAVIFIGLVEPSRKEIIQFLIDNGIVVKLVGYGWEGFVKKNRKNSHLIYLGKSVFGQEYSRLIASSKFALGLLSKRFPELHTTRTFEIPACGTALLTERNEELLSFYNDDEAIYYNTQEELAHKIKTHLKNPNLLEALIKRGQHRVLNSGYDYDSIIGGIMDKIIK